jgi:hypothetical protein
MEERKGRRGFPFISRNSHARIFCTIKRRQNDVFERLLASAPGVVLMMPPAL